MVATPAMPSMTDAQVAAVKGDWEKIKGSGVEILYFFLNKFPGNFPMFKKLGNDLAAAKGTAEFKDQADKIIAFLQGVIEKLGSDMGGAKALLNQLGTSHKAMGITKDQFDQFRQALTELLGNLGFGGNIGAWNATVDLMFHVIFNALDGTPV
ncbi:unnamed protein product [Chironomus riparius]|nr:unnamed protein product [Chironomus riparius]